MLKIECFQKHDFHIKHTCTKNCQILIFFDILFCTIQIFAINHISFIILHTISAFYSPKQKAR